MLDKAKQLILGSAIGKTIVFAFSVIIAGILTGAFITEITVDGKIMWKIFHKARSFYFILGFLFLVFLYLKFLHGEQIKTQSFGEENYCKAYIRSQCLPAAVDRYKTLIRTGRSSGELKEVQSILKDLMK